MSFYQRTPLGGGVSARIAWSTRVTTAVLTLDLCARTNPGPTGITALQAMDTSGIFLTSLYLHDLGLN